MGTRADFYIGRGPEAKWLGSVAWDGYPESILRQDASGAMFAVRTQLDFTASVALIASERDDFTRPEQGWPWPWETSSTTDYAYAWDEDTVWISCFGGPWYKAENYLIFEGEGEPKGSPAIFPDMSHLKNVTLGKRSGLMVFGIK